jgi:jasmonate ZIM domain-containing protein
VVVFDKFPSTKVKDLLQIMNPGGDRVDRAGATATVPTQSLPTPSHNSLSGKASLFLHFLFYHDNDHKH